VLCVVTGYGFNCVVVNITFLYIHFCVVSPENGPDIQYVAKLCGGGGGNIN
jgi:hypothetical protein